jgi:DNA-binding GntR family transcriptional regulator
MDFGSKIFNRKRGGHGVSRGSGQGSGRGSSPGSQDARRGRLLGTPPTPLPTRSGFTYRQLRTWILHGELQPGEKLDQEWLAETLNVSRTPLRQALLMLEADGLVEQRPYAGAVVAPLSRDHLEDVYATRQAVEGVLARQAALRGGEEAFAAATELLERQTSVVSGQADIDFVDLDRSFHLAIYQASGFRTALEIVNRLLDLSERYARVYARHAHGPQRSINEHQRILQACIAGRPDEARRLTERHIEQGQRFLKGLVGQEPGGPAPSDKRGRGGDVR